ncbi:hypothetical protein SAMN05444389_11022 [Paracoccus solventivorans]|uniref:DNA-binding transcriptional regulator, MarR family n=1 Tax=Paracoccus solventivorans TaxID=53463 RepID=A0A1M7IZZ8_9RHOB|nr:MarR family winged helix-turn-helix transcriptional regulator [Paracoccus solventivorans]SHM46275.1 hypothetical protein SAMN05444389_11022 [Paracoccus solventivorans]
MSADDSDKVKEAMHRLFWVVEEVRRQYPRMELGQLAILLSVLAEPGMWARDLTGKVKLKKSALSRNVKALSNLSYLMDEEGNRREGLDLITQIPDALDQRAYLLTPTEKGRDLAERLAALMR